MTAKDWIIKRRAQKGTLKIQARASCRLSSAQEFLNPWPPGRALEFKNIFFAFRRLGRRSVGVSFLVSMPSFLQVITFGLLCPAPGPPFFSFC